MYDLKILNKTERDHRFRVEVEGAGALAIDPPGASFAVRGGEVFSAAVRVRRPAYEPLGSESIRFEVSALDDPSLRAKTVARFIAPSQ